MQLIQADTEESYALAYIIVKFSREVLAFVVLGTQQLPGKIFDTLAVFSKNDPALVQVFLNGMALLDNNRHKQHWDRNHR